MSLCSTIAAPPFLWLGLSRLLRLLVCIPLLGNIYNIGAARLWEHRERSPPPPEMEKIVVEK